jgi:hypothetical protein
MSNKEWVTPICGVSGRELKFEDKLQAGMPRYSKTKKATTTMWLHLDKTEPTVKALLDQKFAIEKQLLELHNQSPTSLYYSGPKTEVVSVENDVEVMQSEAAY